MWIKLSSTGFKPIYIPIRKHKHYNRLIEQEYKLKNGCRLGLSDISFNFSREKTLKTTGEKIGTDIGVLNVWSTSDGLASKPCPHGHTLASINKRMSRKKKGSKSFGKCQTHRTHYVNWSLKQIDLSGVRELRRENLWDITRGKRVSRYLTHWGYPEILSKLDRLCEEQGVLVRTVNPTYTSQRCSECGWTCKSNRKGKTFSCVKCGLILDADINGSRNIVLDLVPIRKEVRLSRVNRVGFYWHEIGQACIVPDVQEEYCVGNKLP